MPDLERTAEERLVRRLTALVNGIDGAADALADSLDRLEEAEGPLARARHCRDQIFRCMQEARALADEAEGIVDKDAWPFPGYGELLTTK